MCGIIAVVRRRSQRLPPSPTSVLADLDRAGAALGDDPSPAPGCDSPGGAGPLAVRLEAATAHLQAVDEALRGAPGTTTLLRSPGLAAAVERRTAAFEARIAGIEAALDEGQPAPAGGELEGLNAALVAARDAVWAVRVDRLRAAAAVGALAGPDPGPAAVEAFTSAQVALSALDRLEVRGRDSAGIQILVSGHGLDLASDEVRALLADREGDRLFTSLAVRTPGGHLSFVYKAAAEIGELGDNVAALRRAIAGDRLLRLALAAPTAEALVLGHTRWASVGIVSQANAHPLNQEEEGGRGPFVAAALNGDVDNYLDLKAGAGLRIPAEITTDAKVIPMLVSRRLAEGTGLDDAFRETVASFEGSVAVACSTATAPGVLHLALRGSGQALYVGLAEDAFVVASEAYGLVEETSRYLRMDGEAGGGQVVALHRAGAGTLEGVRRQAYDGTGLPVSAAEVRTAEITTRDIDRAGFPHFLLKEISEAPASLRKTLRGKVAEVDGRLAVALGDATLPPGLRGRLRAGQVRRVVVIGQGTAAVAGQSMAVMLGRLVAPARLGVTALPATELSGFTMEDDMGDTLVVAISQSGTTTDTNRTVDLVRARGAAVVAVVNRRSSDLVDKADGVLYTSDGRDVEMAVPSTKAFYAQVAAGFLLALAIAAEVGREDPATTSQVLGALRSLPAAMEQVLAGREAIAEAASALAPSRRNWAVVGNGTNRIAAAELRIKLSELCYKSIACDVTEDKKHVDLSAEPLVLVCAAGLEPSTAGDVAKEIAIYRAHKAAPVVIATAGTSFPAALSTIEVPAVHPWVAFLLSAMAGHLFGYEAALAIDAQARPLREVRMAVETVLSGPAEGDDLLARLAPLVGPAAAPFLAGLRAGSYNGHLEASTAARLASLLGYASGVLPLESYDLETGKVGTPSAVVEDLTAALGLGIAELTRPIDAIKHQAKTVTVGISRSEEVLFRAPLVQAVLASGVPRDRLSYRSLRTLVALGPAVEEVLGWTRYRIEAGAGADTIHVLDKGGMARGLASRTEDQPVLKGIKRRVAQQRQVTAARGAADGRTLVLVPETKDNQATGLALLHVRYADRLPAAEMRAVLDGYQTRYSALVDAVTETEAGFDDSVLGEVTVIDLLTEPVHLLARHWRR